MRGQSTAFPYTHLFERHAYWFSFHLFLIMVLRQNHLASQMVKTLTVGTQTV